VTSSLHTDAIVVDGLVASYWSRDVFDSLRAGGVTAGNCTIAVWEGFEATMDNVAALKAAFREHGDIIRQVRSVDDVHAAKREGRVGIVLGWQNLSPIGDDPRRLALFAELGVRIAQLAYNTQNLVGTGCYESHDGGLSDYGRDVVAQLNELGILVDLSHVGAKTTADAIEASTRPVVFSHVGPAALKPHPRNKTDEEMRRVAENGGLVGVTPFPWFLRAGRNATLDDFLEAVEHVLGVVGEDAVGVGTDFTQGQGEGFLEWIMRDKGTGRLVTQTPLSELEIVMPEGLRTLADWPNITAAMERRGWSESRIRKLLGGNWLRVLADVW